MRIIFKTETFEKIIVILIATIIITSLIIGVSISSDYAIGAANITNITVIARVNVTNTEPNITAVTVDDNDTSVAGEIDLVANDVTLVTCNATVWDYNGWQDINPDKTNATFYISSVGRDGPTDNNHRYRNESCGRCMQIDANTAACDCRFAVQYYANYSNEWVCNITVGDHGGTQVLDKKLNLTDTEISSSTVTVTKILAIDTATLLDYQNWSVTQTTDEVTHNVTNVGNTPFNLTLRSYGGTNESLGQNVTMICDYGNITFGYQRYSVGSENLGSTSFDTMTNVTNQTVMTDLTLPHRVNDSNYGWDRNSTIWRLQIPLSVGGICNGTLIFGAIETFDY